MMKKVKAMIAALALEPANALAVEAMMREIAVSDAKIGLLGKACDDAISRVIEMNDKIVELERKLQEEQEFACKSAQRYTGRIDRLWEVIEEKNETIKEMGEKIDADAALVVSVREMPFVCFADDPFAAFAAVVKADIDGAPIDWSKWPGVL